MSPCCGLNRLRNSDVPAVAKNVTPLGLKREKERKKEIAHFSKKEKKQGAYFAYTEFMFSLIQ